MSQSLIHYKGPAMALWHMTQRPLTNWMSSLQPYFGHTNWGQIKGKKKEVSEWDADHSVDPAPRSPIQLKSDDWEACCST